MTYYIHRKGKEVAIVSLTISAMPGNCGRDVLTYYKVTHAEDNPTTARVRKINKMVLRALLDDVVLSNKSLVLTGNGERNGEFSDIFVFMKQFGLFVGKPVRGAHGPYENWLGILTKEIASKYADKEDEIWTIR